MDKLSITDFAPERAMHLSLSATATPLWFLHAGAGAAGAAYFWMNRWGATNLEALTSLFDRSIAPVAPGPVIETTPEPVEEPWRRSRSPPRPNPRSRPNRRRNRSPTTLRLWSASDRSWRRPWLNAASPALPTWPS